MYKELAGMVTRNKDMAEKIEENWWRNLCGNKEPWVFLLLFLYEASFKFLLNVLIYSNGPDACHHLRLSGMKKKGEAVLLNTAQILIRTMPCSADNKREVLKGFPALTTKAVKSLASQFIYLDCHNIGRLEAL